VAGLRREELALLAGVSPDYYQRIEQGRDLRPSDQVLDAVARALNFTEAEARHLHNLAAAARTLAPPARQHSPEVVPETTLRLLRAMTVPALVIGRFFDVLAWSPLAGTLLGEVTSLPQTERNLLRLLLRPEADDVCPNRAETVAELTAMLRTQVSAYPEDPRAVKLVEQLAAQSAEFSTLWARHDVEEPTHGQMYAVHPLAGEIVLDWDAYPIPGAPGTILLVSTAEESSVNAVRLELVASAPLSTVPDAGR
jgi:transcriptional regulator with XRE-family HTH domain